MKKSDVAARALMHDVLDGAAAPADRARFDRLCAERPDLAEEYALLRAVRATTLGLGLARPPADLRARIAAAVDAAARDDAGGPAGVLPSTPARFAGARRFAPFSIAAAALLAVGLFYFEGGAFESGPKSPATQAPSPSSGFVSAEAGAEFADRANAAKNAEPAGAADSADKATWSPTPGAGAPATPPLNEWARVLHVVGGMQEDIERGQGYSFGFEPTLAALPAADGAPPAAWMAQTFAYAVDPESVQLYAEVHRALAFASSVTVTTGVTESSAAPGAVELHYALDDFGASLNRMTAVADSAQPVRLAEAAGAAAPEPLAEEEKRRIVADAVELKKARRDSDSDAGADDKAKDVAKADAAGAPAQKPAGRAPVPAAPGGERSRGAPVGGGVAGGGAPAGGGGGGTPGAGVGGFGPGRPSGGGRGTPRGAGAAPGEKAGATRKSAPAAPKGADVAEADAAKSKNGDKSATAPARTGGEAAKDDKTQAGEAPPEDAVFDGEESAPPADVSATTRGLAAAEAPAIRFVSGPGAFAAVERLLVRRGAAVRELPVLRADAPAADSRTAAIERLVKPEAAADRVARTRFLEVDLSEADAAAFLAELAQAPGLRTLDPTASTAAASRSRAVAAPSAVPEAPEARLEDRLAYGASSRPASRSLRLVVVER
jgi:hypothetical protein